MNRRQLGGRRAKANGDLFERILSLFALQCRLNLIQLPMGGRVVGKGKVIKIPAPFDFIIQHPEPAFGPVFFDAKSKEGDSMGYADFFDNGSTEHQLLTLLTAQQFGTKAGFVVWFRKSDKIVFVDALKVGKMQKRSSIGIDDGTELGDSSNINLSLLWSQP